MLEYRFLADKHLIVLILYYKISPLHIQIIVL